MRRGFSLRELLIVLAVIALLTSIALPVLVQAKASSKSSACLSNMRQIGLALNLYDNFDEPGREGAITRMHAAGELSWQRNWISPGLTCPEMENPRDQVPRRGYAFNGCLGSRFSSHLASTIAFGESSWVRYTMRNGIKEVVINDALSQPDAPQPPYTHPGAVAAEPIGRWGAERHFGKAHYAMLDSHVVTLSAGQIYVGDQSCSLSTDEENRVGSRPRFARSKL